MRNWISRLAAWGFALAAVVPANAKNDFSAIKSVAIISAIGDCLYLPDVDQQGMGLFGKAMSPTCVPMDGIDDAVTAQLQAALSPRFTVKPVSYDRAAFAAMPFETKLVEFTEADFDKQLKAVKNPGVDAYILVTKARWPNVFADSDTSVYGLGIAREAGTFTSDYRMYAYFYVHVIDARTLKDITREPGRLPKTGWLPKFPTLDVEDDLWPGMRTQMSPAQKAKASPLLSKLVHDAMAQTLKNMELTP